jgi:hypothetical protein
MIVGRISEERVQSEHGDQMVMIRGVQHQHDGSSRRLAWDPGTIVFDNSIDDTDEMAIFSLSRVYSWDA